MTGDGAKSEWDAHAWLTTATGVNDAGQIVGYYTEGTGARGFIATGSASPVPLPPAGHSFLLPAFSA